MHCPTISLPLLPANLLPLALLPANPKILFLDQSVGVIQRVNIYSYIRLIADGGRNCIGYNFLKPQP